MPCHSGPPHSFALRDHIVNKPLGQTARCVISVAGGAALAALLSVPIAVWTWWLNIADRDPIPAAILAFDFWLAFLILIFPGVIMVSLARFWTNHSLSWRTSFAAGMAILFFLIWFIRIEPAHQMVSVNPHISLRGIANVLMVAIVAIFIYRVSIRRGSRQPLLTILAVLIGSAGLEFLDRYQLPRRDRNVETRQISEFLRTGSKQLSPAPSPRVLMIGVDGMDWRVVNRLMRDGRLPAIEKLLKNGRYYQMDNLRMRVSAEIWTAVYTGAEAGTSGIDSFLRWNFVGIEEDIVVLPKFGFHSIAFIERVLWYLRPIGLWSARPVSNDDFAAPPLWTVASVAGKKVAVVDPMPMNSSPEEVSGVFVVTQQNRLVAFSGGQKTEVKMRPVRQSTPAQMALENERREVQAVLGVLRRDRYDVAIYYSHFLDAIQHYGWDFTSPGCFFCGGEELDMDALVRSVIAEGYIEADRTIAALIDAFGEPATVVLVSDHGWEYDDYEHFVSPLGIFAISPVRAGSGYGGAVSVLQIAPTVLTLSGLPPGVSMAEPLDLGQAVQTPRDYSKLVNRTFFDVTSGDGELIRRLHSLGYIGR